MRSQCTQQRQRRRLLLKQYLDVHQTEDNIELMRAIAALTSESSGAPAAGADAAVAVSVAAAAPAVVVAAAAAVAEGASLTGGSIVFSRTFSYSKRQRTVRFRGQRGAEQLH